MFGSARPSGPPQFRLAGVPIRIEPMFWLVTVFIALAAGDTSVAIGWVVIVTVSLLLHELGHAAAFLAFGSRPSIVLHGLGGVTVGRSPGQRWKSVTVSLAGATVPLVLLGLPALYLSGQPWSGESFLRAHLVDMVVWVNVWWGLVNLLPIVPLDGGHVLEQFVGPRVARIVTIVVAVPLGVVAWNLGIRFGLVILGMCALQAYAQLRTSATAGTVSTKANVRIHQPSAAPVAPPGAIEVAARQALAVAPHDGWARGTIELIEGKPVAAMRSMEAAALHGPPPIPAVSLLGDEGMAPRLAERLLQKPGERPAGAVAELAGGLLAAERFGAAALVAERLAADRRSPAMALWAAGLAAEAWGRAGDGARAERWAVVAAERAGGS